MLTVLHYTGYSSERGGIISVINGLHAVGRFGVVQGVAPSYERRSPGEPDCWRGPTIRAEKISVGNFLRARTVAVAVREWLRAEPGRVFHGHSRAGLLVGLWLQRMGERRVVVSVHCYGSQRWFYRLAARVLGERLFWLTPAMRRYYGIVPDGWRQCLPGGVPATGFTVEPARPVPGKLRLGGGGSIVRWKRWDLVIEAMALLPVGVREKITFEHIGGEDIDLASSAYRRELVALTARHGLEQAVKWCGAEADSTRLLGNIDVLVVPSHQEPYSMILQEALAAGAPVIAAQSGGPMDVLRPEVNGRFFADGDAVDLARVLQAWVESPRAFDREKIRATARRAETAASEWEKIYATLPR